MSLFSKLFGKKKKKHHHVEETTAKPLPCEPEDGECEEICDDEKDTDCESDD